MIAVDEGREMIDRILPACQKVVTNDRAIEFMREINKALAHDTYTVVLTAGGFITLDNKRVRP